MDIKNLLLKEHSLACTKKIVQHIGQDQARFQILVDLFLNGSYRITQRAAWPISYCVEEYPALIKPHLKKLIKNLRKPGQHDAVKRNTLRMLQFADIPKSLHGELADISFTIFNDKKEAVAIRVFAMSTLARIVKEYPELTQELIFSIENDLPYESPAFVSRGKKVLKALKQN